MLHCVPPTGSPKQQLERISPTSTSRFTIQPQPHGILSLRVTSSLAPTSPPRALLNSPGPSPPVPQCSESDGPTLRRRGAPSPYLQMADVKVCMRCQSSPTEPTVQKNHSAPTPAPPAELKTFNPAIYPSRSAETKNSGYFDIAIIPPTRVSGVHPPFSLYSRCCEARLLETTSPPQETKNTKKEKPK
ncbi:hypothetical protein EX30DRAFT_12971 [Ascodesmis nigricans]|uniref:Uncharacterized protein n=1 Tax=Ascodesmis nigricans TaxID=341454 RepID=A0A4S2N6P5_9PEZI|nr:hypothetical protein EX30DRAFT_12971 [Ascodesmis nigricans]